MSVPGLIQKPGDGTDPNRVRASLEKICNVLNSLILSGDIKQTGPATFTLAGGNPLTTKGDIFTFGTGAARLGVGANGDVLTANSAATLGIDWEVPSGGGSSVNAWEHPFTKPVLAGVTQVNTTGFTSSDDTNGLFVWRSGTLAASDNLCLTHIAVPGSGAWNLDVRVQQLWADDIFAGGGGHLYESGTGKIITFGNQGVNPGQRLSINYFNSTTSFNSFQKTVVTSERITWFRISYDGTANYSFWQSMDGYSYVQFGGSLGKTAFFTTGATHAGFWLDPNTTAYITGIKCMSLVCA